VPIISRASATDLFPAAQPCRLVGGTFGYKRVMVIGLGSVLACCQQRVAVPVAAQFQIVQHNQTRDTSFDSIGKGVGA
jgi:hypothetical protein